MDIEEPQSVKPVKAKRKAGQPTKKTPEIIDAFCTGIAQGKSARAMTIELGITQSTLWKWLAEDNEFSKQYARAKELCADLLAAEVVEIADDREGDKYIDEKGRVITDNEAVNRSRLRVDARKWYASKLAPKKYGDKMSLEHEGGDPDKPILTSIKISFVPGQSADIVQLPKK